MSLHEYTFIGLTAIVAALVSVLTYAVLRMMAAARDTGTQRLDELGINRAKGEETIRSLLEGVTDAAKASGQAALDAARKG